MSRAKRTGEDDAAPMETWMGKLRMQLPTPSESPSEELEEHPWGTIKHGHFPKSTAVQWDKGQGWEVSTLTSVLHPLLLSPYLSSTGGKHGSGVHEVMWNLGVVGHVVDTEASEFTSSLSSCWKLCQKQRQISIEKNVNWAWREEWRKQTASSEFVLWSKALTLPSFVLCTCKEHV